MAGVFCIATMLSLVAVLVISRRPPLPAVSASVAAARLGVAAIPLSAFYGNGFDQRVVRFCFAKQDQTLQSALQRLQKL